jgi:peptidoglycan/LPS O-acetylase OafA/YrhL
VPYRGDLDGLRAVAVALVAVYHVWVHRVSGGVDVFLVLSGFFVGGGLLRSFSRGTSINLRTYLPRLARRLLPALVVVLAAVVLATAWWLPRTRWADVSHETLAALLHLENWYLALADGDYGAADQGQSPLQHVWSMSVQGQLFIAVPVVLLAAWWLADRAGARRPSGVLHAVVALLAGASFVYAASTTRVDQGFAYYDTFARSWEYLAGVLLAVVALRLRLRRSVSVAVGWLGLALVFLTGAVVDGASAFPGPATLMPVVGAALVVLAGAAPAGTARGGVTRVLAWRPLARAGGYAYAFYLWHWPVLVFATVVRDRPVGWLAGSGVLVLSALLAITTKHCVEDPLRAARGRSPGTALSRSIRMPPGQAPRWRRRATVTVVASLAVAVVVAPLTWTAHVRSVRSSVDTAGQDLTTYPGAMAAAEPLVFSADPDLEPVPDPLSAGEDKVRAVFDGCGVQAGETTVTVCSYGDLDAPRVVAVVGGSHAEQWIDAIAAVGQLEGFRVDTMIRWGCSLVEGRGGMEEILANDPTCLTWSQNALTELEHRRPDVVFTTATRPTPSSVAPHETVPTSYVQAWERLGAQGIRVVAIRDNPWLPVSAVACVAEHGADPTMCSVPRGAVLDAQDPTSVVAPALTGTVRFIDVDDVICPDETCPFVQGGRLVYRDEHHLTATYAASMVPVLRERLGPALGWW